MISHGQAIDRFFGVKFPPPFGGIGQWCRGAGGGTHKVWNIHIIFQCLRSPASAGM